MRRGGGRPGQEALPTVLNDIGTVGGRWVDAVPLDLPSGKRNQPLVVSLVELLERRKPLRLFDRIPPQLIGHQQILPGAVPIGALGRPSCVVPHRYFLWAESLEFLTQSTKTFRPRSRIIAH